MPQKSSALFKIPTLMLDEHGYCTATLKLYTALPEGLVHENIVGIIHRLSLLYMISAKVVFYIL